MKQQESSYLTKISDLESQIGKERDKAYQRMEDQLRTVSHVIIFIRSVLTLHFSYAATIVVIFGFIFLLFVFRFYK